MSDLCKCGHDARHHAFGKCNAHACCGNEKCDTTFLTDPDAPPADRDDLAAILAKHTLLIPSVDWVFCEGCDWEHWKGDDNPEEIHRAHVAQMVLESDWLRGVRAKELRDAAAILPRCRLVDSDRPAKWRDEDEAYNNGIMHAFQFLRDRADAGDGDNTTDRTYKIPD